MNAIEVNTLRRSLWLTREQAGKLNGMTERSWRYLEDGTRAIPDDVQKRMRSLDAAASAMADAIWDEHFNLSAASGDLRGVAIVLVRYANTADLLATHPDLPVDMHSAAIDRARIMLEGEGATVRIVLFDAAAYRDWLAGKGMPDNQASRAAWAATATDPVPRIARQASGE